jgi:hypothetical protein
MPNFDALNDVLITKQQVISAISNPQRGQLISISKAGTVIKNSLSKSTSDISQGPVQDVDVYKVLYWSSQTDQNGPQIVSGSLLVPSNITKTDILQTRNGATWQSNDFSLPWFNLANGLDLNLISYETVSMAGLGYVTVHADGFGLGANEGRVTGYSDYFGEINPHVDILRAIRTKLPAVGFKGSIDPVKIIYFGYSNGAVYSVGIVNELVPGNSAKISADEASKFSYQRLILGSCPNAYDQFNNIALNIENEPIESKKKSYSSFEVSALACWFLAGMDSGKLTARPSAYNQIINSIVKGDYWGASNDQLLTDSLGKAYTLNVITNPPSIADPYKLPTARVGDFRQIFNCKNWLSYGQEALNNHGWTNPNTPLNKFPQIPITMIYAASDQVDCPVMAESENLVFVGIATGTGFDGPATLDPYMSIGKTYSLGPISVTYSGAGKTVTVNKTFNDKDQASVQAIANAIKNTTGNNYLRMKIETINIRGFNIAVGQYGRGDHLGNAITWFESTYYALR